MKFKNEFTYRKFLEEGKETEFDRHFDNSVAKIRSGTLGKTFPIYINGKEVRTKEELVEYSPINGSLIGRFQKGDRNTAIEAISAAKAAFHSWSTTNYKDRIKILRNAASIISTKKFELAAILSIENGKTRYESIGEVDEAIDFINYYCIEMERNKGFIRRSKLIGTKETVKAGFQGAPGQKEKATILFKPYGVFGVIAPFNFPVSISTGMSVGAMLTGNTVVFKPSCTDNVSMLTGLKLYEIFKEAGLPDGVFNYVTGPGSEVGDALLTSPDVAGIAFTGSRETGLSMIAKSYALRQQKVFIVEMGGKNAAIVTKNANLDDAASGISSAAFGFSGQKCSACSRVYVHESVKEEFVSKLLERTRSLKIGDPLIKGNYIGPLISVKALERYKETVTQLRKEHIMTGGNLVETGVEGLYVEPVVAEAEHGNPLFKKELFLPILLVDTYKKLEDAIRMANDSEYGLTAGLYSKKTSEIKQFLNSIEAGTVYVNRAVSATTGAIVGFHTFVGWKGSGLTGKGTGSREYLQQFMREQSQAVVK